MLMCVFTFLYLSCGLIDDMGQNYEAVKAANTRMEQKSQHTSNNQWVKFNIWALYLVWCYLFPILNFIAVTQILYLTEESLFVIQIILNGLVVMVIGGK